MTVPFAQIVPGKDWLRFFKKAGVIFEYPGSALHIAFEMAPVHSGFYFNIGFAVSRPELVRGVVEFFSAICKVKKIDIDWVVSYVSGIANGIVFADDLAQMLSVRSAHVNLQNPKDNFQPQKGEIVLIFTDDIISGRSLGKTIEIIETNSGNFLSPIFTLGNFYGASIYNRHEIVSLIDRQIKSWTPDDCPLCKSGSSALKAHQQWQELSNS